MKKLSRPDSLKAAVAPKQKPVPKVTPKPVPKSAPTKLVKPKTLVQHVNDSDDEPVVSKVITKKKVVKKPPVEQEEMQVEEEEEGEEGEESVSQDGPEEGNDDSTVDSEEQEEEEEEVTEQEEGEEVIEQEEGAQEEGEEEGVQEDERQKEEYAIAARYKWLSKQMKKPIPVRPVNEDLKGYQFLWVSTSPDLKKNKFEYEGEIFSNPTMPLRKIYEAEGKEVKKASIKGWTDLEALVKRSINAETPLWTVLNKVLPSNFRCSRKRKADEEPEETTKKAEPAAKKAKRTEAKPKKVQKTEEAPVSNVKRLSTKRVMGYADATEEIEPLQEMISVSTDTYHKSLGYTLKYAIIKNICNFSTEQVIKPINAIAREANMELVPDPTVETTQVDVEESEKVEDDEQTHKEEAEAEAFVTSTLNE